LCACVIPIYEASVDAGEHVFVSVKATGSLRF
jgi:hypothetical protein